MIQTRNCFGIINPDFCIPLIYKKNLDNASSFFLPFYSNIPHKYLPKLLYL